MWIMISEYDISFGGEYKLFESLNPVCQTAGKDYFASWLFASNTNVPTWCTRTGNRPSHAVAQGSNFSTGGQAGPPPADAAANTIV